MWCSYRTSGSSFCTVTKYKCPASPLFHCTCPGTPTKGAAELRCSVAADLKWAITSLRVFRLEGLPRSRCKVKACCLAMAAWHCCIASFCTEKNATCYMYSFFKSFSAPCHYSSELLASETSPMQGVLANSGIMGSSASMSNLLDRDS